MTICIAALLNWDYAAKPSDPRDPGSAAIVISDRMITAGDIQYEPNQLKMAWPTPQTLALIAGDYSLHSQAIKDLLKQTNAQTSPENVAKIYGQTIQAIKRREAEDLYLAPVGLNTDTFLAQQSDLSDGFVAKLREQLQGYQGADVAALIVGSDVIRDQRLVRIFTINSYGMVHCHDDVGFAAIGTGASHAESILMQAGYVNTLGWGPALAVLYAAKRVAEIAPGVGKKATDIY
ncbi:MAG: hypothetical protein WBC94_10800, partial [Xanthobacteraceae bacterium]